MKFVDIFKANISTIATVSATVQIILYIIGVVINIKIVLTCWINKKHNKSWQLHILYSLSCIIIFAFDIPYWLVTLCVPHLSNFTGEWICYLALFVNHFFISLIVMNSLMVAITKYIYVVHWDKALLYGDEKIQWTMFCISLLLAFPIALFKTAFKRHSGGAAAHSCSGSESKSIGEKQAWENFLFFWCSAENISPNEEWNHIHVVLWQIICVITHGLFGILFCNLPEAFFYHKIFKKMDRLDYKI